MKTLEKEIHLTRVCEDAIFARRVSVGMSYKTVPNVDDGVGDRTSAHGEYTFSREDPNSRIYATIPGQTTIGPVLQVHVTPCLDISGIEIQIPSTTTKDRKSGWWWVICRGINRHVEELHLNDPDHNPTSSELLEHIELERCVAKEREPGSTKMVPSWCIEETHAKQVGKSDESSVPSF